MQQPPRSTEQVLRQSDLEYPSSDTFPERHYIEPEDEDSHSTSYFGNTLQSPPAGALYGFQDALCQRYVPANDFRQSHTSTPGANAEKQREHALTPFEAMPRYGARDEGGLLRGVEAYVEHAKPGGWNPIPGRGHRHGGQDSSLRGYSTHSRSISLTSPAPAHMQSLPYPSSRHSSAPPQAPGSTKFAPFGDLFGSSEDAKHHRKIKMRFDRHAYNPEDGSIAAIQADRARHVERIYNAMVRGDRARDNEKSVAMKRWTREPHYASDLVEAYAHKVFDCLLEQSKEGFRGWHHNDYVVDDRKGDHVDRDIDCAGRLDNVILALEQEKTICEDVMNSACQIRMFVNAPRAYANRKHQNRIGNSKRPNAGAKDESDANPRVLKARKIGGRKSRGRSSTVSDVGPPRTATPQQPLETTGLPYFVTPGSQRLATSPLTRGYLAPSSSPTQSLIAPPPLQPSPFGQRQMNIMSPLALSLRAPPQSLRPALPTRITSMPPNRQSPFSPPPFTHDYFPAAATHDDAKPGTINMPANPWDRSDPFDGPAFQQSNVPDDPLFTQVADWSQNVPPGFMPCEEPESANLFANFPDGCVSLADIERLPPDQIVGGTDGAAGFEDVWNRRDADEHFSYDDLPAELRPQS